MQRLARSTSVRITRQEQSSSLRKRTDLTRLKSLWPSSSSRLVLSCFFPSYPRSCFTLLSLAIAAYSLVLLISGYTTHSASMPCDVSANHSSKSSHIEFKYPSLSSELDLQTLQSISPAPADPFSQYGSCGLRMRAKQNSIPLGESSFDVIPHRDRDEIQDLTSSVASIDEHTSDEIESLADTDISTAFTGSSEDLEESEVLSSVACHQEQTLEDIDSSGLTTTERPSTTSSSVRFNEPQAYPEDYISVSHTLRVFNEAESSALIPESSGSVSRLVAVVRQSMARTGLYVDGAFRVLYVGDSSAREDIIAKIGSALAVPVVGCYENQVRYSSSRFTVVPISEFGSGRSPTVELIDSFGIELVVDYCSTAKTVKGQDSPDTLQLYLNDALWFESVPSQGGGFRLDSRGSWQLPDLAISYSANNDSTELQKTRHFAKAFLARHGVPSINISEEPKYKPSKESYGINPDSIHIRLEPLNPSSDFKPTFSPIPVDLQTFLQLDSRQMNRNLAYLTRRRVNDKLLPKTKSDSLTDNVSLSQIFFPQSRRRGQEKRALWLGSLLMLILSMSTLLTVYLKVGQIALWRTQSLDNAASPQLGEPVRTSLLSATSTTLVSTPAPTVSKTFKSSASSMPHSVLSEKAAPSGLTDIANILFDPALMRLNNSDKFELHLIGDYHMILKPPHRLSQLRKPPKLFVRASRAQTPIDVKLSKIFDGVYALQLEREEAYGLVNLSVWTTSKPIMKENFNLDLGTPWLKMINWRKAAARMSMRAHQDLKIVHSNLNTALERVSTEYKSLYDQASKQTKGLLQLPSAEMVNRTKFLIMSKTTQIAKTAAQKGGKLSGDLAFYRKDISVLLSQRAGKGYRAVKSLRVSRLRKNIHAVALRDVLSEARRHVRILRGEPSTKAPKLRNRSCRKCHAKS